MMNHSGLPDTRSMPGLIRKDAEQELGQFAAWLLAEIEADREVLQGLGELVGGGSSKVKELTTLGEKVTAEIGTRR